MKLRLVAAVVVLLAGAVGPGSPSGAAPSAGPLCTTAGSEGANVNTDCLRDGSTAFETALAVNPANPRNLVGVAISGKFSITGTGVVFTATVRPHVSFDGGETWTTYAIDFNRYDNTIDPTVGFDANGRAYLAVAASAGSNNFDIVLTRSADGGRTWSSADRIAAGSGSGGAGSSNDHPNLAAWGDGNVVVTWIHSNFGPQGSFVNAPVFDSVSDDGGENWSPPASISGSAPFCTGSQGNHACDLTFGNSVAVSPAGVLVSFQDTYQNSPDGGTSLGRNKHMVVVVDAGTGSRTGGPFLVGQAYDGINEHDFPVDVRGLQTLQDSQLNLDLDGNIASDPTAPGHFAVVWYDDRNATHPVDADPYNAVTNSDIVVSQTFDAGRTWSTPTTIAAPHDQFMPRAVYDGDGHLRVGYNDRSYDPANHAYGYTLATETGRGTLRFTTNRVSTALSDPTQGTVGLGQTVNPAFPNPAFGIGDYSAVAVTPGAILTYWTDMRRRVCANGQCGATEDAFFARVPSGSP